MEASIPAPETLYAGALSDPAELHALRLFIIGMNETRLQVSPGLIESVSGRLDPVAGKDVQGGVR